MPVRASRAAAAEGVMAGKVYIETHGCQMNEYDSARMRDVLQDRLGMTPTSDEAEADLFLLNTCSVREKAQEKVFSRLGRLARHKESRPDVLIGVGGCVASQEGEALRQRAPQVDLVFGPQTLHRLPDLILQARQGGDGAVDVSFPEIEKFDCLPEPSVPGASAFVSIMEGCSKYCSFCVVPYTRGEEVSRPFDGIVQEVVGLAGRGVREVTLLGQNVNAWRDRLHDGQPADFALLLRYVSAIDGIERVRYTTSHPREFTDSLIRAHAEVEELAAHVHLPVQSGSDRVLAAMKRGYTALEYKSIIRKLKATRPDISVSSDFIVGFPGETEEDFVRTCRLAEEAGFDQSFSFLYSPRPGTPAAELDNDTPLEERKARLARLQKQLEAQGAEIAKTRLNTVQQVLVEGPSRRDPTELAGRASDNRVINFKGPGDLIGTFQPVRVTEMRAHSLRGDWASAP